MNQATQLLLAESTISYLDRKNFFPSGYKGDKKETLFIVSHWEIRLKNLWSPTYLGSIWTLLLLEVLGCPKVAEQFTFKIDTSSILGISVSTETQLAFNTATDAAKTASEILHKIMLTRAVDKMSWFHFLNNRLTECLKEGQLSGQEMLKRENWVSYVDSLTRSRNNISLIRH